MIKISFIYKIKNTSRSVECQIHWYIFLYINFSSNRFFIVFNIKNAKHN